MCSRVYEKAQILLLEFVRLYPSGHSLQPPVKLYALLILLPRAVSTLMNQPGIVISLLVKVIIYCLSTRL